MRADEVKRWSAASHDDARRAVAGERCEAGLVEINGHCLRELIDAFGKDDTACPRLHCLLDGGGVIAFAIAFGPEIAERFGLGVRSTEERENGENRKESGHG